MMLSISWQLTLVALCIVPISLLLVGRIVKSSQKYFVGQQAVSYTHLDVYKRQIEYRLYKTNIIHCPIGKVSFGVEKLQENFDTLLGAIGQWMRCV